MTTLYLVRHGEVLYKTDSEGRKLIYGPDIHLNDLGKEQLTLLGKQLAAEGVAIDTIFASPFVRAQESAALIAEHVDAPIVTVKELHDSWMPGWYGLPMETLLSINGSYHSIAPLSKDQETLDQVAKRIVTAIDDIVAQSTNKTVVVVSHGDPLAIYIHNLLRPNSPPDTTRDDGYPAKGQARRVLFDDAGKMVSCEHYRVISDLPTVVF